MNTVREVFGSMVFGDEVMRERLPRETYLALRRTIREGRSLGRENQALADVVASAMKDWAVEKGATHYTHWFQPMTGITAEKHESFLAPTGEGAAILEFSGKELIRGEPDASSFPSGGLRATFEARGYTAWDPTSYAFIKDDTLCIPTAFCSYGGEALDKKTPLLRSMEALSCQAVRVLRLFGDQTTQRVSTSVGVEQEYFLVDERLYDRRPDLKYTGRTLFGAKAPKGQELDDHYFGALKARVKGFMEELNTELWKLGVYAKTEHNEVAPSQHELAPIYTTANIAADHNQLTMETMKKVARRHGFVCLLHEKPYAGVNGSGKHNNWSLTTDTGINLFEPGKTPYDNMMFLLFVSAMIKAVDKYSGLLRLSTASYTNDCRLGGYEAPPAILSMYLGSDIHEILQKIADGNRDREGCPRKIMDMGVATLPRVHADSSDRNRTSPFAFTGNKFEFRMLGASMSISWVNTVLNTICADVLSEIGERLQGCQDFDAEVQQIISEIYREHGRILFNGNGYGEDWEKEARARGLRCVRDTVEAAEVLKEPEVRQVFEKFSVHSGVELDARYEIVLETYSKKCAIEAKTMLSMCNRQLLPAVRAYLAQQANEFVALGKAELESGFLREHIYDLDENCRQLNDQTAVLRNAVAQLGAYEDPATAAYCRDVLILAMRAVRETADYLETVVDKRFWPLPTYDEILFDEQA